MTPLISRFSTYPLMAFPPLYNKINVWIDKSSLSKRHFLSYRDSFDGPLHPSLLVPSPSGVLFRSPCWVALCDSETPPPQYHVGGPEAKELSSGLPELFHILSRFLQVRLFPKSFSLSGAPRKSSIRDNMRAELATIQ